MSATSDARDHQDEPQPADGTSPADAVDTSSAPAAGRDVFAILKGVVSRIGKDQLTLQASAVAYNFIFAIVPLLIFITALSAAVTRAINDNTDDTVQTIVNWLLERMPQSTVITSFTPRRASFSSASLFKPYPSSTRCGM